MKINLQFHGVTEPHITAYGHVIYAFTREIDTVQRCLLDITGSIFADAFLGICAKIFFLTILLLFFCFTTWAVGILSDKGFYLNKSYLHSFEN